MTSFNHLDLRPARAPARRRAAEPRPVQAVAQPVVDMPPASQERPDAGGNRMNISFRPIAVSGAGRSPVTKATRPPLGFAALVERVDKIVAGATATPAELADLRRRATAALEAAVGTGKEAAVHFVIRKLDGISASARPVEKAAGRGAVPPVKEAGADPDLPSDADLAAMEAEAKRLLARAPESERPKIAGLLSDIAALRAAVARGAVLKAGGLHPLRRLALARAEATRSPVEKRGAGGGGGVHPLRRLAMARAAGGHG